MTRVRALEPSDWPEVCTLLGELGYMTLTERLADRVAQLDRSRANVLVAVRAEAVVGVAAYDSWFAFVEGIWVCRLSALCVAVSSRREGVGRALVNEVERRARLGGCAHLEVSSGRRAERAGAHAFYPALGFEERSHHHALYCKPLEA